MPNESFSVTLLDVSGWDYASRLAAASLQGLLNRSGPRLFLDYGYYDDIEARKTNEMFMPDDLWYGKYRDAIGPQDQRNLAYYQQVYDLQITHEDKLELSERLGLPVAEDLRGRWQDRVELYTWMFENLFSQCKEGMVACIEPGWKRPEFTDYIVQNRIFSYSLSAMAKNGWYNTGQKLLLLLLGGPFGLRNLLYNLQLDGLLRRLGMWLMGLG